MTRDERASLIDGRYELEALISKGGMGNVYRARHRDLGRTFALKLVTERFRDDPAIRQLFVKEAQLASSLTHPNVVSVTDFGIDEDHGLYLVTELLEGETLRERMKRDPVSLRFAFDVIDKVTSAVSYIHGRGVVHCDLKPENIYLAQVIGGGRRSHVVKLLDFGLSWRHEVSADRARGTPPFVAPERYHGAPPSPASDVYALGMILYELVCGQLPFQGPLTEIMRQQATRPVQPPSLIVRHLDACVDQLVKRALAIDPAERHASAEAFQFELRTAMNMLGVRVRDQPLAHAVESSSNLGALMQLLSVMESPVPLAVFETTGRLRLANRTFVEHAHQGDAPVTFGALRLVRAVPELDHDFELAVTTAQPQRRVVEIEGLPVVFALVPLTRASLVEAVHATWYLARLT